MLNILFNKFREEYKQYHPVPWICSTNSLQNRNVFLLCFVGQTVWWGEDRGKQTAEQSSAVWSWEELFPSLSPDSRGLVGDSLRSGCVSTRLSGQAAGEPQHAQRYMNGRYPESIWTPPRFFWQHSYPRWYNLTGKQHHGDKALQPLSVSSPCAANKTQTCSWRGSNLITT